MNRQLRSKPPLRRLDINAEQILNPRQAIPERRHVHSHCISTGLTAAAFPQMDGQCFKVWRVVFAIMSQHGTDAFIDEGTNVFTA